MKVKRFLVFLAGILFAISAVWITNQPEQVSASVFQKTSVPKKFRGTWYGYGVQNKLKAYKITRSRIRLAGYSDNNFKTRTYKLTDKSRNATGNYNSYISHQLIKSKGNRMQMSYPSGETAVAYVTSKRKKLYVGIDTAVDTYYKSKSAAKRNHKADRNRRRSVTLKRFVWQY